MSIHDIVRGIAWVAEGLDLADRPEGKWAKALIATATALHADQKEGVYRSDDEVWAAIAPDVRDGYHGDQKRLVADVRKTITLIGQYADVLKGQP